MWVAKNATAPAPLHVDKPSQANIVNPARLDSIQAINVCIQCHSQGQPLTNPIDGKYYDWPVGFQVGMDLKDFWKLEEHKLGEQSFTHFADGTAHKNRMQGNDFVQSAMYTHGVTCYSCHDVHGTGNNADLLKPANVMCLECHGPKSPNGPHARHYRGAHASCGGQRGRPMRQLPHAENRAEHRGRQRPQPYVPLRHARRDRVAQGPERLQRLP